MLLAALFVFGVALEVLLIVGKDYLSGTRRQAALEESIQQTQTDLRESQGRIDKRRAELLAAVDDAERRRKQMQEADKAFAESQKIMPSLVHVIGIPYSGQRFRAPVSKQLPLAPDRWQKMIWAGCKNFVEIWADDLQTAKTMIAKQFQEKQGYSAGEPVPFEPAPQPVPAGPGAPPVTEAAE